MNYKSKRSKMCEFSKSERQVIYERDNYCCIFCYSNSTLSVAHYIPRSKGGLGIKENGALACQVCHRLMDFGSKEEREKYNSKMCNYLTSLYGKIEVEKLKYRK